MEQQLVEWPCKRGIIIKYCTDYDFAVAKISVTSAIVQINMPAREILVGETKNYFI